MSSSEVPVTVVSASGKRTTIEVSLDVTLEDTLVVAEAMMVEPLGGRRVQLPGRARPLQPGETLRAQGVTAGATLYVDQARPTSAQPAPRQPPASVDDQIRNLFGGAPRVTPPGTAPPSADVSRTIEALFASGAQQRQPVLDPDDPEVQRRAYEAIQQRQVEENLAQAMEETPEAFGSVVMLYVQSAVNNVPVAAFIDSGAQMTVMSARVAEQCNLTRLIDRRFKGIAKGVGTTNIIGRIHMAQVRIGPLDDKVNCIFLPMSITVVEQDGMDFLIGLDQLRRHRMCIDLEKNCLRIGDLGKEFSFLAEHELPEHIRGENQPDPTSPTTSGAPTGQQRSTTHANGSSLTPQQGAMIQALQGMFPQADRTVVQNALEASNWQLDEATTFLSASF